MENISYLVEREGGGAAGGDVMRGRRGAAPLLPPPGGGDGALHSPSELHLIIPDCREAVPVAHTVQTHMPQPYKDGRGEGKQRECLCPLSWSVP